MQQQHDSTLDKLMLQRKSLEALAFSFTKNIEDAHDLVQDTMLKAIRFAPTYRDGTNYKAWLTTILRNTFINAYRKKIREASIVSVSCDFTSVQLFGSSSKNGAVTKCTIDDIRTALNKLRPEVSVPFIKYFEGYKYQEIAETMNLPIGTIKTRIHQARIELKKILKMYAYDF